jgi:hypothetical protein
VRGDGYCRISELGQETGYDIGRARRTHDVEFNFAHLLADARRLQKCKDEVIPLLKHHSIITYGGA